MWVYALIGAVAGVVSLIAIGAAVYCVCSPKRPQKTDIFIPTETFEAYENPIWKKSDADRRESLENLAGVAQSLKVFSFTDLQSATDDFNPSCLIKGSVYQARINGDLTAIKRINRDISKEISLVAKINHFNLIRVLGVCRNEGHCYIVYEYASNGPLSDWIYHNNVKQNFLSWKQRAQIFLDVARGLNYIHSYFTPPHVHKDLKSSNILLDSDFRAKIINFALPGSADRQDARVKGYLSPEYLQSGQVSPKLDVYSFGVLMLEMITGKEVSDLEKNGNGQLSAVFAAVLRDENGNESLKNMMDPSLKDKYPSDQAVSMAGLIDSCLKKDPSSRPGMEEIVRSLSKVLTASLSWKSSA